MNDETQDRMNHLHDLLEQAGCAVTGIEVDEYGRGHPSMDDFTVTGAEITIDAYILMEELSEDTNPYEIKNDDS